MISDLMEMSGATIRSTKPASYGVCISTSSMAHTSGPVIQIHMDVNARELLVLDAETANWVIKAARKLEALGQLKRNWDSHDGLPLSQEAKRMTFDALKWLKNQDLPVPAVVLGSGGTVHLEWRSKGKELEIGFDDRGFAEYLKVDSHGEMEEEEDINDEIREKLMTLVEWLKKND